MKNLFYGALALCATALVFSSCNSEDNTLTGVNLNQSAVTVAVGGSVTLTATAQPTGATASFEWSSSNTDVAIVNNGVVTGVSAGTAYILASAGGFSANCLVTVSAGSGGDGDKYTCLNGSNYYVFMMDETTATKLKAKTIADLRVNDSSISLFIWPAGDSYAQGTPSGKNYFGEAADWFCLTAQPNPWGGVGAAGFNLVSQTADLTAIDATYTFHIAYKSTDAGKNEVCLFSADGSETWFELPAKDDGLWYEHEISMSTLFAQGVSFNAITPQANNVLAIRTTGAGKTINVDACFIYKK